MVGYRSTGYTWPRENRSHRWVNKWRTTSSLPPHPITVPMKHPPTEESIPIPQTAAETLASPPTPRGGVHPRTRSRPPPPGGSAPWAPRRFRQPRRGPGPRWACRCPTSTTTPASGRSSSRCPSFPLSLAPPKASSSVGGGGWCRSCPASHLPGGLRRGGGPGHWAQAPSPPPALQQSRITVPQRGKAGH